MRSPGDSGGIYDKGRRGWLHHTSSKALKAGQWNKYRVEARGDQIRVWVNGEACADLVDPVDQEGFIALQVRAFQGEIPALILWRKPMIADPGRHVWKPVKAEWEKTGGGDLTFDGDVITGRQEPDGLQRGLLLLNENWTDL